MIPLKLEAGDEIRIVAPSDSIPVGFRESMRQQTIQGFEKLGLKVTFGKYVDEVDEFETTTYKTTPTQAKIIEIQPARIASNMSILD